MVHYLGSLCVFFLGGGVNAVHVSPQQRAAGAGSWMAPQRQTLIPISDAAWRAAAIPHAGIRRHQYPPPPPQKALGGRSWSQDELCVTV